MRPSRKDILTLMWGVGLSAEVIKHSLKVERKALEISLRIASHGSPVDLWLVRTGALIHDIGRSRSHRLDHGILGAELVRESPLFSIFLEPRDRESLALICERHIGGGLTADEAAALGLPRRDFFPRSKEEKIISHADNLVLDGVVSLEESRRAFLRRFGAESPVYKRIFRLGEEIERMVGGVEGNQHSGEDLQEQEGRKG